METVRVAVQAGDPVAGAGIVASLSGQTGIEVVSTPPPAECDVVVFAVDRVRGLNLSVMRRWAAEAAAPVVLVARHYRQLDLLTAVECRVRAVLSRRNADADRLGTCVLAVAKGDAVMPPDLLGDLMREAEKLRRDVLAPRGLVESGLDDREVAVLGLIADGLETAEIAVRLRFSERTVKYVLHSLTTRLNLRSRAHAVAYALRAGLI